MGALPHPPQTVLLKHCPHFGGKRPVPHEKTRRPRFNFLITPAHGAREPGRQESAIREPPLRKNQPVRAHHRTAPFFESSGTDEDILQKGGA